MLASIGGNLMGRRVLVVEDDVPTRQMIAVVLEREDYAVDLCADHLDAAERLRSGQYGAVVLALVNRDPSVHNHVLRELQGKPACVVVISAGSQAALDAASSDLIRARLRKPFQIRELTEAVARCFDSDPASA
jgi:two-component system, chemotaxis family, chemotaxis protein CheY